MQIPTLTDVLQAAQAIAPYLRPTPFQPAAALSDELGCEVFVKYENCQPVRAFKVRGGINLVSQMDAVQRARGLIAASTGNHGQSIAYAGRLFGARVVIGVPADANPVKVAAMRALGAAVVAHGPDFDAARQWVEDEARATGMRYVHSANEPLLIAGVGTMSLEMLHDVPDLDVIISPVGGGSGAAGHCIAGKALRPGLQVIGVQAEGAPAIWRAFHHGGMEPTATVSTFAEGLATRVPFALTLNILRDRLDDLVLVSDQELRRAMVTLVRTTRMLAEAAGAAATAAAFKLKDRLRGKKVGLVLSGANVTAQGLQEALAAEL